MRGDEPTALFWIFMVIWVCLGGAAWWFFFRSSDVALKQRVMRWGAVGTSLLFIGFALAITREPWMLLFLVPAVALISFLNIKLSKFCASCGATLYNYNWFVRMRYCSRCGASLEHSNRPA
jgi:hypothetical protein